MDAGAGGGGDEEGATLRAPGPLFRVTEVFLRDDASGYVSKSSTCYDSSTGEVPVGYANSAVSCSDIDLTVYSDASAEYLDLAQQMNALGLPTSFKTNKEQRRNTSTGDKRKGMLKKPTLAHEVPRVQVPDESTLGVVVDIVSSQVSDDGINMSPNCIAIQAKCDESHFEADDMFNKVILHSGGLPENQDVGIVEDVMKEQLCTKVMDVVEVDSTVCHCNHSRINEKWDADSGILPYDLFTNFQESSVENVGSACYLNQMQSCELGRERNLEGTSSLSCVTESEEISVDSKPSDCFSDRSGFANGGEWGVFFDAFYMRNYFYNYHTQESTWYTPPGLEGSSLSFTSGETSTDVAEVASHLAFSLDDSNHQGTLEAAGLSQELRKDGEVSGLTSQEVHNDGEVSGQTSQEGISRHNYANESSVFKDLSFSNSNLKDDEHVEQINCSERGDAAKIVCAVPFCPEDMMDCVGRLTSTSNKKNIDEKGGSVSQRAYMISMSDDLYSQHRVENSNRKRKVKRIKSNQTELSGENKDHSFPGAIGVAAYLAKYWHQRYLLFSKFDLGVKMDEEGWFSVTPESIARHHASRCGHGSVIDCFTGVGGNAIQFAMRGNHVIAIDIDPQKVDYAQHNATIYGVGSNIDFIKGDFFALASNLKADAIFMSPPWGGPDYSKVQTYDIRTMLKPHDGYFLFKAAMKIASLVVMFLPRNVDPDQLAELSLLTSPHWELEVEKNYLNGRLKGITAYFRNPFGRGEDSPNGLPL